MVSLRKPWSPRAITIAILRARAARYSRGLGIPQQRACVAASFAIGVDLHHLVTTLNAGSARSARGLWRRA